MKNRWQIILGGVGGQGLISCGSLLAEAAIKVEDRYATLTTSYGTETRGTFTKSDVIISDNNILFPDVIKPDVVLALAQVAYDRYVDKMGENTILVYDSGLVKKTSSSAAKQYGYEFTEMARDLGAVMASNNIALGFINEITSIVKNESLEKAIANTFTGRQKAFYDVNLAALKKGIELAKSVK